VLRTLLLPAALGLEATAADTDDDDIGDADSAED